MIESNTSFEQINQYCVDEYNRPLSFFIDLAILARWFFPNQQGVFYQVDGGEVGLAQYLGSVALGRSFNPVTGFGLNYASKSEAYQAYYTFLTDLGIFSKANVEQDQNLLTDIIENTIIGCDPSGGFLSSMKLNTLIFNISILLIGSRREGYKEFFKSKGINKEGTWVTPNELFESEYFLTEFDFSKKKNGEAKTIYWEKCEKWLVCYLDQRTDEDRLYSFLVDQLVPLDKTEFNKG